MTILKTPARIIGAAFFIVLAGAATVQYLIHHRLTATFWQVLALFLFALMGWLAVRMIRHAQQINPKVRVLPPPFGK